MKRQHAMVVMIYRRRREEAPVYPLGPAGVLTPPLSDTRCQKILVWSIRVGHLLPQMASLHLRASRPIPLYRLDCFKC